MAGGGPHGIHRFSLTCRRDSLVGEDPIQEANFRLAQYLLRRGKRAEAVAHFSEASRLHPDSWTIWRQAAEKDASSGFATGPEFWSRVDALGDRSYHRPIDMKGL